MTTRLRRVRQGALFTLLLSAPYWAVQWDPYVDELPQLPHPHRHLTPLRQGGTPFRWAMAYDAVHDLYPLHTDAYYLALLDTASDDLTQRGLALTRLGRHDEALDTFRTRAQQLDLPPPAPPPTEEDVRRLRARALPRHQPDERTAEECAVYELRFHLVRALLETGDRATALGYLHQAVETDPSAHFGAPLWTWCRAHNPNDRSPLADPERELRRLLYLVDYRCAGGASPSEASLPNLMRLRIPESFGLPYDIPALAISSQWILHGHPKARDALELGKLALQRGQRLIAWSAYERARSLSNPDTHPAIDHIQAALEDSLERSPADLRAHFDAELARGHAYQRAYQTFERERLTAGHPPDHQALLDAFHTHHPPAWSDHGRSGYFFCHSSLLQHRLPLLLSRALLCLTLGAWLGFAYDYFDPQRAPSA